MLSRNLILLLFFFAKIHSYQGCVSNKNKVNLPCKEYDLNRPYKIKLNESMSEISGISFYPKDTTVFAISDDNGILYKIHFNKNIPTQRWKFDKANDFEDIFLHDSTFYILASNGNIETLNFSAKGDTIYERKNNFPDADKNENEFESMYYDDVNQQVTVICKDCKADKKNKVSSWSFNPENDSYSQSQFAIDVKPIKEKLQLDKIKLKPSASAVNPITNDVWILASVNQLLIVTDRKGYTKSVYTLDPLIFNQPEGITFTPWGDLLISNEAGDKYSNSSLLIFKRKKNI